MDYDQTWRLLLGWGLPMQTEGRTGRSRHHAIADSGRLLVDFLDALEAYANRYYDIRKAQRISVKNGLFKIDDVLVFPTGEDGLTLEKNEEIKSYLEDKGKEAHQLLFLLEPSTKISERDEVLKIIKDLFPETRKKNADRVVYWCAARKPGIIISRLLDLNDDALRFLLDAKKRNRKWINIIPDDIFSYFFEPLAPRWKNIFSIESLMTLVRREPLRFGGIVPEEVLKQFHSSEWDRLQGSINKSKLNHRKMAKLARRLPSPQHPLTDRMIAELDTALGKRTKKDAVQKALERFGCNKKSASMKQQNPASI